MTLTPTPYELARSGLFRLGGGDAETAHERVLTTLGRLSARPAALRTVGRLLRRSEIHTEAAVFGLRFPNRVGLAAGMDKNATALPAWRALGFGFVEVGTVTARPQPGNDRPRLFRIPDAEAIINRMGFNNDGAQALAVRLAGWGAGADVDAGPGVAGGLGFPVGVSLGKSKLTPLADAVDDYRTALQLVHPYADYIAVNVSSPNTPGLRDLQAESALRDLLAGLTEERDRLVAGTDRRLPLLVKLAPDLDAAGLAGVLEVCLDTRADGLIATNTTLARPDSLRGLRYADQTGGLSGAPLTAPALATVTEVVRQVGDRLPVIGVGGIMSADDAVAMFDAGAALVQLYSGFIYHGPGLIGRINRAAAVR